MPIREITKTISPKVPALLAISSRKAEELSSLEHLVSTGTKDWAKAPSAKRRRKKLGIRLAKKKTSAIKPAPRSCAMAISRIMPRIRERKVAPAVTMPERSKRGFLATSVDMLVCSVEKNRKMPLADGDLADKKISRVAAG